MRYTAVCTALFALAMGRCLAEPVVLSSEEVELVDPSGDTLANATAEAQLYAHACQAPNNTCRPRALSPRQLVPASDACSSGVSPVMAWRRADDLQDTDRYAAELQRYAATRELFDCSGAACLAAVPTTTRREKESGVATLSICRVQVVEGVSGPPSDCQEAVKRREGGAALLRGQVGDSFTDCSMGFRDFDAVFEGQAGNIGSVSKLVGETLRTSPFDLTVMEDGNALVGTRNQWPSKLLGGWREWIHVRAEIAAHGNDAGATIFTNILVSKQATSSREAWTPASEPQEESYLRALRDEFQHRGGLLSTGVAR